MRRHDFAVPDPVKTEEGWSILVPPGDALLSMPSKAFRMAAFVTCRFERLGQAPGPGGTLVMSFPEWTRAEEQRRVIDCLRRQGFRLPEPVRTAEGGPST